MGSQGPPPRHAARLLDEEAIVGAARRHVQQEDLREEVRRSTQEVGEREARGRETRAMVLADASSAMPLTKVRSIVRKSKAS
jgi:hypothetical protein